MATIRFKGIPPIEIENLRKVFEFIAMGKRNYEINENELARLLAGRYKNKFWWPTTEEREDWQRRWYETPVEARFTDPSLKTPWDFGSWIDAFLNAEIELKNIDIDENGVGELEFEQLACPSGGIEATEEIIKLFDGEILSNDAT